jgi:flagellar basal body-associated protein FliL
MTQGKKSKAVFYIILIVAMFLALYSLDTIFGFHYEPEPLDQAYLKYHTGEEKEETSSEVFSEDEPQLIDKEHGSQAEEPIEIEEPEESPSEENPTTPEEVKPVVAEKATSSFFETLLDDYKKDVLNQLPKNKARTDIVIRYYRHLPDGNSAYALENLGYYIHERPITPGLENYQSNAMYYGDSVKLSDIQIVAHTLLKEGLPIKVIEHSKFGSSWKSKSIEIGTDTALTNLQTLRITDIQNFKR